MIEANQPVFTATNRGYRYGDGFFETARIVNSIFPLASLHKKRIERSVALLQYIQPVTSIENIFEQAIELSKLNGCEKNARVRLSFFNGSGSVFDDNTALQYVIEASPLPESFNALNNDGLRIAICADVRKSCDTYANLKSANYIFSRVAIELAKKNGWDDALILNQHNHICESAIANIFWVKESIIYTPPLTEGCVDGVMRAYLISKINVTEKACSQQDLADADEFFLTNATSGIRWVKNFESKAYSNVTSKKIYNDHVAPLWLL